MIFTLTQIHADDINKTASALSDAEIQRMIEETISIEKQIHEEQRKQEKAKAQTKAVEDLGKTLDKLSSQLGIENKWKILHQQNKYVKINQIIKITPAICL